MKDIKLIHGNCLEVMDDLIKKGIKVDAIITDPPYGTTACKWDLIIPFEYMWERLKEIRKDKTPIILFGCEPFSSNLRLSNLKEYKYDWKWNKINGGNPLIAKYRPLGIFEDIIVFGKGKINYFPQMTLAKKENKRPRGNGYNQATNIIYSIKSGQFKTSVKHNENLRYPKNEIISNSRRGSLNSSKRLHSTQKPVELLEYLIRTYTNEEELVLDFTMGSGTTGVACKNLNRHFIGIDNGYCTKKGSFEGKSWVEVAKYRLETECK